MKKIFLFAALAGIVFASCQKEASVASVQNEGQQEVTFSALSKAMTKGVLGSGTFDADRTIQVAGVMKTADGQYVDFLAPTEFAKDGTATPAVWRATDPVYYPIGGDGANFSFLAYSETTPETGGEITEATFARWYGSSQVELQVSDKSAKNEIVYAGFKGNKNGAAEAAFKRTQALVTVYIHPATGDDDQITINEIGFKDVKTSGTLLLTIDPKSDLPSFVAKHQWLFNAGCNCAFAKMGNYNLGTDADQYDDPTPENNWKVPNNEETKFETITSGGLNVLLPTDGFVLDRLFPAQELETKKMVINYTLGSLTTDVELDLTGATLVPAAPSEIIWAAGKRYVYDITVNIGEILIDPHAPDAWVLTTITGVYDPESSMP